MGRCVVCREAISAGGVYCRYHGGQDSLDIKDQIIFALRDAINLMPCADSSIKAAVGSYLDTMGAEDTLASIKTWVEFTKVSPLKEEPEPARPLSGSGSLGPKFKAGDRVMVDGMRGTVKGIHVLRRVDTELHGLVYAVDYDNGLHGFPTEDRMEPTQEGRPQIGQIVITEKAHGFPVDITELLDTLKPRRYEAFTAPTIPNPESDKPVPCFVMTYAGDREVTVSLATFRAMKPGVEYLFGCGSNIVVKRHGDTLIARKLETFHRLSELEG